MYLYSDLFKTPSSIILRLLVEIYGVIWLFVAFFLFIVALFLGAILDLRFLFAGILILCLGVPLLIIYLYYFYGLRGYTFLNVLAHYIAIHDGRVEVSVSMEDEMEEEDEDDIEWREYMFSLDEFGESLMGKEYFVILFKERKKGFLYIPSSAFDEREEYLDFCFRLIRIEYENNKR